MRRLAASVGAVALTAGGMLAMAPAFADTPENIDPDAGGSIIVHKHEKDSSSTDRNPAGKALEGVTFTVQEVLHGGQSIDLSTAEGWADAESVFAETAPDLPAGFTLSSGLDLAPTDDNGLATFTSDHIGVFLVTEKDSGPNLVTETAVPFWVAIPMPDGQGGWNYNVDVYPKNELGEPGEPTKVAGEEAVKAGDEFTWTISVDVPAAALPYTSFTIEDVLPAELTFVDWVSVSIGGTVLTDPDDYTVDPATHKITFTAAGLAKLSAAGATTVTAVLKTKVNEIPANGEITNKATITVNGSPKDGEGKTNYGELLLQKNTDGADEGEDASLPGAEFELYDAAPATDGTPQGNKVAEGTTNAAGQISWTLWVGNDTVKSKKFWLRETKAPAGHVLPANPWTEVTVNAGEATQATVTITNHKPEVPQLPLTGAQGTMVFLLVGLGLIGAGGTIAGVRRARMNS